jgi:hypothetical protein
MLRFLTIQALQLLCKPSIPSRPPLFNMDSDVQFIYWNLWDILSYFLWSSVLLLILYVFPILNRLCDLVVRVAGYMSRGPDFDFWRYQVFWDTVGLERGPLGLVRIIEELFQGSCGSNLENRDLTAVGIRYADHVIPSISKKRRFLGQYTSLAD